MKCYVCSQPVKKKTAVIAADTYQDLLGDLLKQNNNDVHTLCLGDDSPARVIDTRDRVAQMLETYCQAEVATALLSSSQPFYEFK